MKTSFSDWPGPGPIDLNVQDLPHRSSELEWWYVNAHFITNCSQHFSLFAAFFRILRDEPRGEESPYSHYITWGIIDPKNQKYLTNVLVDPLTPQDLLKELNKGLMSKDLKIRRALAEIFEKGHVLLPDQLLQRNAIIKLDCLDLDYDGNLFFKRADNSYELQLFDKHHGNGCNLIFTPQIPPVRYGINAKGTEAEKFYYFIPRCDLKGEIILSHQALPVKHGKGWYDHEFGRKGSIGNWAWNWLSVQFDNNWELILYDLINMDEEKTIEHRLILIDPEGKQQNYAEFQFEPTLHWTNTLTFNKYPVAWQLNLPEAQLSLRIKASLPNQECLTIIALKGFWEGRVEVVGTWNGQIIKGLGVFERTGFNNIESAEEFFKIVGNETKLCLNKMLPSSPSYKEAIELLASKQHPFALEGVNIDEMWKVIINPIKDILYRGGKAWRSYIILAIIDLLEKDSNLYRDLLTIPELLHVGSLIIDDVQDHSEIRRGGPTTHKIYGEALAINAGTICYFLGLNSISKHNLSKVKKTALYENYLEVMRIAHVGQGLDIKGLNNLMPQVVETGNITILQERLLAIHRLKSGAVPATIGRFSAIIADANKQQIEVLDYFLESLGLAFQLIDDVLNLEGFTNNLKTKGEDITEGKITMPIVKAMSCLSLEDRHILWDILSSKPTDSKKIEIVIKLLEKCDAFTETRQFATDILDKAWQKMDELFPDSFIKLRLRIFSWFILEQHY